MPSIETNGAQQDEEISDETLKFPSENGSNEYQYFPPMEWNYHMRRYMQQVVPGLYLGPYRVAIRSNLEYLLQHRITHIVCVRQNIEANIIKPNFTDVFRYLVLDIADTETQNIIQHFRKVKAFIDEGLNSGGRILVHSNAGISRSPALVLAYVMETYALSSEDAFRMVIQKRCCINPNKGFKSQLREYEAIYQAQQTLGNRQQSSAPERSKRSIHQLYTDRLEEDSME